VRSANKGTLLASDNIDQRRAALAAKLATHERARAFYMPGHVPSAPNPDEQAERAPLYLPSMLRAANRARHCRDGLVDAETEIRLASMSDALDDLLRHLQTRTFIQRFKARNVQGVQGNTRAQDSIAGVSRRVDAAATAYRRH
jgi:hypothetical protein